MVQGNVGLAFGLVIAAGLCTALGACSVFCTRPTNTRALSGALGVSAGVMMYVSFVEIFATKSVAAFISYGLPDAHAYRYATFSFFAGIAFTHLLGLAAHAVARCGARRAERARAQCQIKQLASCSTQQPQSAPAVLAADAARAHTVIAFDVTTIAASAGACKPAAAPAACAAASPRSGACAERGDAVSGTGPGAAADSAKAPAPGACQVPQPDACHAELARMGLLSALAVGLHNLPEGMATFVAALASQSTGVAIAVAVALHNIPEGVVIAMPIYYATGSRWKGFLWSLGSGLTEPLGGLLAFCILSGNEMNPLAYAVMFGVIAGVMVYISLRELLPMALRFDPSDTYATSGAVLGMAVMAGSLLLFQAHA